jgi:hypothetical protein
MAISMYQATVPGMVRMMTSLQKILDKAQAMATARKMDEARLLDARLFPDMLPLSSQIQSVSDNAKGLAARLAGVAPPSMPDTETTIAQLKDRLGKTIDFLKSLDPAKFEGAESRMVNIPVGGGRTVQASGLDYVNNGGLPNFYFHATTAYDILRHYGLDIGKGDYLGNR